MREIKYIVLHCTATPQTTTIESIKRYWKSIGWKSPGYHVIIKPDGEAVNLQPIEKPSNGVKGHNADSIHISYIGGLKGDDRTDAQKQTQIELLKRFKKQFPHARILGHTDFPGVSKLCPNFDVAEWLKCVGLH